VLLAPDDLRELADLGLILRGVEGIKACKRLLEQAEANKGGALTPLEKKALLERELNQTIHDYIRQGPHPLEPKVELVLQTEQGQPTGQRITIDSVQLTKVIGKRLKFFLFEADSGHREHNLAQSQAGANGVQRLRITEDMYATLKEKVRDELAREVDAKYLLRTNSEANKLVKEAFIEQEGAQEVTLQNLAAAEQKQPISDIQLANEHLTRTSSQNNMTSLNLPEVVGAPRRN